MQGVYNKLKWKWGGEEEIIKLYEECISHTNDIVTQDIENFYCSTSYSFSSSSISHKKKISKEKKITDSYWEKNNVLF